MNKTECGFILSCHGIASQQLVAGLSMLRPIYMAYTTDTAAGNSMLSFGSHLYAYAIGIWEMMGEGLPKL